MEERNTLSQEQLRQELAPHFTLIEMIASGTASRLGIDNTPPADVIERLRLLCQRTLWPLRRYLGRMVVTSGYRCEALNKVVGGVARSQHLRGEAADIYCPNPDRAQRMMRLLKLGYIPFDQMIVEHRVTNDAWWIHVSYRGERYGLDNRLEVIDENGRLQQADPEMRRQTLLRWAWAAEQGLNVTDPQCITPEEHRRMMMVARPMARYMSEEQLLADYTQIKTQKAS